MRQFLALAALLIASCATQPACRVYPVYRVEHSPKEALAVPIKLDIDAALLTTQEEMVERAIKAWEAASGGVVQFHVKWNRERPGPFKYTKPSGSFFWYLPRTEDHFTVGTLKRMFDAAGFVTWHKDARQIVVFQDTGQGFYAVAAHELGHLLGLQHIGGDRKALMNKSPGRWCVTRWDAAQLCEIYDCDPEPECLL